MDHMHSNKLYTVNIRFPEGNGEPHPHCGAMAWYRGDTHCGATVVSEVAWIREAMPDAAIFIREVAVDAQ